MLILVMEAILTKRFVIQLILCCVCLSSVRGDTPANCTYEDIRGLWIFKEGPQGQNNTINCSIDIAYENTYTIQMDFPNIASDDNGNIGYWTIICNQGFEVVINDRKFFAFSYFEQDGKNVHSYCDRTFPGWSHQAGVKPTNWACFEAEKYDNDRRQVKTYTRPESDLLHAHYKRQRYEMNGRFVESINSLKTTWQARSYEFLTKMTINDIIRMTGGKSSRQHQLPKSKGQQFKKDAPEFFISLPDSFDWRDVDGVNYVSPIRDQGSCGSCYAFASMAMNEARLRIQTNNTQQTVFSTQDIIDCSQYSQGCDGGFPYLVSGKFAEDYGLVEESCAPYTGKPSDSCSRSTCTKPQTWTTNYRYIGGFYGACSETLMRIELVKKGPFVVSFQIFDDFLNYQSGVYHHTNLTDTHNFGFNPFELVTHAVLLVGYGSSETEGDYWIAKNSWGTDWGEAGFFRIRRGTDECHFESAGVATDIYLN